MRVPPCGLRSKLLPEPGQQLLRGAQADGPLTDPASPRPQGGLPVALLAPHRQTLGCCPLASLMLTWGRAQVSLNPGPFFFF